MFISCKYISLMLHVVLQNSVFILVNSVLCLVWSALGTLLFFIFGTVISTACYSILMFTTFLFYKESKRDWFVSHGDTYTFGQCQVRLSTLCTVKMAMSLRKMGLP